MKKGLGGYGVSNPLKKPIMLRDAPHGAPQHERVSFAGQRVPFALRRRAAPSRRASVLFQLAVRRLGAEERRASNAPNPLTPCLLAALVLLLAAPAPAIDETKVIDLTYSFGPETVYWPTAKGFQLEVVSHGKSAAGFFYAANNFCSAEHGGTHMDAPIHFAEGRASADEVPVTSGIGPIARIDVSTQATVDADYRLTVADLEIWEQRYGRIPDGAIVLMFSGWGARWPDRKRYLGTDVASDTAHLHFPGFSREAAAFLVRERRIDAIGVDTPSIDHGPSQDFIVHQVINGANKPAFENLAHLDRVPATGAMLIALPMKIAGGSGGPLRAIAILP